MVIKKINLGGKIPMRSQIDTFEMLQIQLEKDVNKIDAFEVAQLQLEKAASIMNLDPNILILSVFANPFSLSVLELTFSPSLNFFSIASINPTP